MCLDVCDGSVIACNLARSYTYTHVMYTYILVHTYTDRTQYIDLLLM